MFGGNSESLHKLDELIGGIETLLFCQIPSTTNRRCRRRLVLEPGTLPREVHRGESTPPAEDSPSLCTFMPRLVSPPAS
jgi:hypothetical protein